MFSFLILCFLSTPLKGLADLSQKQATSSKVQKKQAIKPTSPFKVRGQKQQTKASSSKVQKPQAKASSSKLASRKAKAYETRGPKKQTGWQIPYVKQGTVLQKLKLKKGDRIYSIKGQAVRSKKQVHRILASVLKQDKPFSVFIKRDKKDLLISYQIKSYKGKTSFVISEIKKTKHNPLKKDKHSGFKKTKKRGLASSSSINTTKGKIALKKETLKKKKKAKGAKNPQVVPKKYKPHLQVAYVLAVNSFVYQKPDFDSLQVSSLASGKQILISKKVFRPQHNFGSFYKVFLFKGKKVVGYISEAEVVPEFIDQDGQTIVNPAYKLAKKQMEKDKALDSNLIDKVKKKSLLATKPVTKPATNNKTLKTNKKRYIGLSTGYLDKWPFSAQQNLYLGIKLSGYRLLISYFNMDINALVMPYDFKFFYFDFLASYPLLQQASYHVFITGGVNLSINERNTQSSSFLSEIDKRVKTVKGPVDYGLSGGLSLVFPLQKNLLLRGDFKGAYGFRGRSLLYGLSASLQVAF